MSFQRTSETGTFETPSETIGALIARAWDLTNTGISEGGVAKVKFIFDQTQRNPTNKTAMQPAIVFNDGGSFPIPERTGLGHGLIGMSDTVIIDVFGENQLQRKRYEFEIYRILRKFRPIGNSTVIKKSNNTDDSPIHDYDEILPEFVAFDDGLTGREVSSRSSAILTLLSEWEFTP